MNSAARSASLTRQLVWPVVGLLLAAVLANVGFAAWLAARRSAAVARAARDHVADALAASRVSLSGPVLDALRRLTGHHFIVWDDVTRTAGPATLPDATLRSLDGAAVAVAMRAGRGTFAGRSYRVNAARSGSMRPQTVLVLTPDRAFDFTTLEAVWPVLAVAAATLAFLVPLGLRTTRRLAQRITAVERHVARIAEGEFGHTLPSDTAFGTMPDEIGRLVEGVNHMSEQLGQLRDSLVAGERQRLLGQLAAGFAHELRNAVTGARLAIELHRRRCDRRDAGSADDSLDVAIRQLDILEEEVRGLLALGKVSETAVAFVPLEIDHLLGEIIDLTAARCDHAGVRLVCAPAAGLVVRGRRESLRAALVNLALNGIDAAGRGGDVRLSAALEDGQVVIAVEDSGAGPPVAVADSMLEPFVTTKPEGIGLGLAVARAVAEEHGGTLAWKRHLNRTRFTITVPAATLRGEDVTTADPLAVPAS